jgi:tripartite-type tricarboxylate transporter receptor subunit TctC
MMALDEFILWVNADKPYKTVKEYVTAIKAAPDNQFKMGGTGSKQEDQIITVALEKATGKKMTVHSVQRRRRGRRAAGRRSCRLDRQQSDRGGRALARGQASSSLRVRLQEARLQREDLQRSGLEQHSDLQVEGLNVEYLMLRGYFMPPGVSKDVVAYYVDLFKKVRETPEWKKLMDDGAYNQTFMTGDEYAKWVADAEKMHESLMKEAGFLASN